MILSGETAAKQIAHHADYFHPGKEPEAWYARVQELLDNPEAVFQDDDVRFGLVGELEGE